MSGSAGNGIEAIHICSLNKKSRDQCSKTKNERCSKAEGIKDDHPSERLRFRLPMKYASDQFLQKCSDRKRMANCLRLSRKSVNDNNQQHYRLLRQSEGAALKGCPLLCSCRLRLVNSLKCLIDGSIHSSQKWI